MINIIHASLLIILIAFTFSGCKSKDSSVKESSVPKLKNDSCALSVHLSESLKGVSGDYNSIYIKMSDSNYSERQFNGNLVRLSKNKYVNITVDYDFGGVITGNKFTIHDLSLDHKMVLFERPSVLIESIDDNAKNRLIRKIYPEIPSELFPLPDEKGYVESDTEFEDDSHIVAFYKNIVYLYDGFSVNNLELTCHGRSERDKGPECKDIPCVAHIAAYILDLKADDSFEIHKHISIKPEFWNGSSFVPIFSEPIDNSLFKNYEVVKSSYYPLFDGEQRTFAFYPYPTNGAEDWTGRFSGSTLFAVRENSYGREEYSCTKYYDGVCYDNEVDYSKIGEQSIILNIPDDKLPPTVANIKDDISKAPNGCGYIDWEKQEIVFGDMHQKADWLPFVNGIYWLDEDEEFPIERYTGKDSEKAGSVENESDKDNLIRTENGASRGAQRG